MDKATVITFIIALVGSGIALAIERFWKRAFLAAALVALIWGSQCVYAFHLQYERLPPFPWTATALDGEPWESLVWPTIVLCLVWPWLWQATTCCRQWLTWCIVGLAAIPLVAALSTAERFGNLFVGNNYWMAGALLTIAANALSLEQMTRAARVEGIVSSSGDGGRSSAGRWALLVLLAQLLTATALVMTCYGSWGDWCKLVSLALAVMALVRLCAYPKFDGPGKPAEYWSMALSVPVLILSTGIFMHIRDYSQIALPSWLAPLALLIPSIVCVLDQTFGVRRGPISRMLIAAAGTLVLCATIIGVVLAQSSSE